VIDDGYGELNGVQRTLLAQTANGTHC